MVEDGRVVEFDEPVTLFDRRESIFRGLVRCSIQHLLVARLTYFCVV